MATIAALAIKVQANIHDLTNKMDAASKPVEQLKAKFGEMSPIVQQAQENVGKLSTKATEMKMQMQGLKSVMMAINNAPFAILMFVFKLYQSTLWRCSGLDIKNCCRSNRFGYRHRLGKYQDEGRTGS